MSGATEPAGDEYTRFVLRLPKSLYARIQAVAEREDRSVNGQIVAILRRTVAAPAPEIEDAPNAGGVEGGFGSARGRYVTAPDFDEPLPEFADYH